MMERLLDAERNLTVGLVDQAEAIYRSLAEADPRNAVAVVGLARCALERGDERGAYDLAVRALEIDPDDAMALRMEARLSEVLATRGTPVTRPAFVLPGAAPEAARGGAAVGTGTGPERNHEPGPDGPRERAPEPPPAGEDGRTEAEPARRRGLFERILGRKR